MPRGPSACAGRGVPLRRLGFAVLAAWGLAACAQTGDSASAAAAPATALQPPRIAARPAVPATVTAGAVAPTPQAVAAAADTAAPGTAAPAATEDPLAALIAGDAAPAASVTVPAPAQSSVAAAVPPVDPDFVGPPEPPAPPPPPPLVLFPHKLGEFQAEAPAAPAQGTGAEAGTPSDAPPVLHSQLPADDPAVDSVWRLSYSGRAAVEDRSSTMRACPGGALSTGIGSGLACRSAGEVRIRESVLDLDGGAQVMLIAQARGTDATTVNGRPAAIDPYALVPQFYTAVSGLAVLDGATMWAGRRDNAPFLMSSGLLPPNSTAMRFGVDNARLVGDIGLNYQYTARADQNGQNLPSYHSLRTAPIPTNEQGSVQLGFTRVEAQPLVEDSGGAWWASALHEQKGVLFGTNRLGVQFGAGSRNAMTGYTGMGPSLSRTRVADSIEWKSRWGLSGAVEQSLQFDRSPVGTLQWTTTRLRPAYVASSQFRLNFEVSHDQISSGFGVSGQRTALTVAPTFTLGKSAGNANLRAFYTYSRASDVDGIGYTAPADAWASQPSGSIFGVQLNRRW
ncbi:carbohydrate porin [Cupriavidus taiwanensis]|uniref:Putative maltoporin n=1 Tax=Cupriavidus taiwanensis TaxID=164546 RepID=A0A7Z7J3W8_9BURK|nr:carbohydrate porin [Cupriavidus taiwanensis]SOY84961.1 putative maltoporin [Cupriavidus taiwanensis]SOZ00733.1 putative maltoporin [Cupriavidus taiwanensis]SOZ02675.1 putative maltoporin [Cupriavidus taiwanensis]SPC06053.1 putative maltoporin [Cupriavidus taiwanensis]SPD42433.1 putative maltoporin [Cupriavidus taiwanensis]